MHVHIVLNTKVRLMFQIIASLVLCILGSLAAAVQVSFGVFSGIFVRAEGEWYKSGMPFVSFADTLCTPELIKICMFPGYQNYDARFHCFLWIGCYGPVHCVICSRMQSHVLYRILCGELQTFHTIIIHFCSLTLQPSGQVNTMNDGRIVDTLTLPPN